MTVKQSYWGEEAIEPFDGNYYNDDHTANIELLINICAIFKPNISP